MTDTPTVGVIGGSGQLGGAIARAWLKSGCVAPGDLWISNRSGSSDGFEDWPDIHFTTANQELVDACAVVLLSVPPHLVPELAIAAQDRLVLSVMAGITIEAIRDATGAGRIVRVMSSPAADLALAFSPWVAANTVNESDRAIVRRLFRACGTTDEVPDEDQIDRFTALTGPVPGFVAFFAECMAAYATKHGVDEGVANRAICQLFKAGGQVLGMSDTAPAEFVDEMIAYAGTTAAGLQAMQASALRQLIDDGLDAAYERTKTIASTG